ncbi:site-specific integrase [Clostridium estertheticum]|uniref:tyrosine-type recombinase/integrase n=1 Tax=Clostridium estertheticum TaxID=238834 RepID=UPI001C0C8B17|nr:site-specific integrase [Clostridium estertheticum]MBU3176055.1 site-specific integrase [Clostridium estertheticum]
MQYSTLIRKKDKGYQYVITYKVANQWKTKSKQGYDLNKAGKELARIEMDAIVSELKAASINKVSEDMIGITFGQFRDKYLDHMSLYREAKTVASFKTVLNHFIGLNDIVLSKVSLSDVQEVMDNLSRIGLSPTSIHEYLGKLNTFFKSAMDEHNLITSLPTKNIKIAKVKKSTEKRALTKDEADKLLEDIAGSKYYLIVLIALKCGLRLGEILGLTWDNIDIQNKVIKVTQQWKLISEKEYGFGSLKSKNSNREVPIPIKVLPILKSLKDSSSKVVSMIVSDNKMIVENHIRVFTFKNNSSVSVCLNSLLKKNGHNITIHELRHTYATTLISNGVPFKTAAQFLGHTVQQTMATYSHVNDDMVKKATNIIDNIL